ncbi:transcriptional regulator [Stenotrophomonas geniculata]|uniref:transcriptional regulator n=1 Tax=Stenotrophomonas geniculata TaxID=86188 RepID=UPI00287FBFC6|nr:transcriptional regulator [Stenotrophomonas geniculata]WNF11216.1 transcriptional regulator [Stenotrophomonas geniculata]
MTQLPDSRALLQLDRLIHEPARLLILSILAGAESAEFGFVEHLSGLSKGNLSSHLSKLEAAGLVAIDKSFRGKRPLTTLQLTPRGRTALAEYRTLLAAIVAGLPDPDRKDP